MLSRLLQRSPVKLTLHLSRAFTTTRSTKMPLLTGTGKPRVILGTMTLYEQSSATLLHLQN